MITSDGFEGVVNNIVVAHHVGVAGRIGRRMGFRVLATYSRNYGVHTLLESGTLNRYETELPLTRKDQFSFAVDTRTVLLAQEGVSARVIVAYDQGDLLPNRNLGITLGIRKEGAW
jgi:hypothetical protein